MPIKIYLSQANQAHNAGPLASTEKAGMNAIAWSVAQLLMKDGRFEVKRNSAGDRIDTAYRERSGGEPLGRRPLHRLPLQRRHEGHDRLPPFAESERREDGEGARARDRRPLAGQGDRRPCAPWDGLIEIKYPNAPAVLIELEAHDWKTGVQWLTTKRRTIARELYEGICRGVDLEPRPGKAGTHWEDASGPCPGPQTVVVAGAGSVPAGGEVTVWEKRQLLQNTWGFAVEC